jgi:hypothetical protein
VARDFGELPGHRLLLARQDCLRGPPSIASGEIVLACLLVALFAIGLLALLDCERQDWSAVSAVCMAPVR